MKNGALKRHDGGRAQLWLACAAVATLLLGFAAADAHAQQGFDMNRTMDEAKGIGTVLMALIFLAYIVVGGIVILSSLATARERGQWSHFLIALGAVVVAGFVLACSASLASTARRAGRYRSHEMRSDRSRHGKHAS